VISPALVRVHRYIALGLGFLVVALGLAGAALVFRDELTPILTPAVRVSPAPVAPGQYARILAAARSADPAARSLDIAPAERADRAAEVVVHGDRGERYLLVDPHDGTVTDLYTECDGRPLRAPNDLVMDGHGGFYFTDHAIRDHATRTSDLTAIYYARADGSEIREVAFPVEGPNGIGLSPDSDTLYWAETTTGRVFRRAVVAVGQLA